MRYSEFTHETQTCSECGGPAFSDLMLAEKKDACYNKVKSRYKVWPSAYASGALVQCRKKGAANWGNKSEGVAEASKQKLTIGSKVTHPIHGEGTVVMHSTGGGNMGTVVKFANGKKAKVDHKKLTIAGQGVAEGGFDNASPMTKDTVKSDRIRSLKNLIAIAKEQGRQLRVQELELELKKLQGMAEDSIDHRIAQAKKNNPLRASVAKKTNGYAALVMDTSTGKPSWFGGALWQTPELAMGHAKAFVKGFPYLEQEYAQRFIDKNRNGIVGQGVAEGRTK